MSNKKLDQVSCITSGNGRFHLEIMVIQRCSYSVILFSLKTAAISNSLQCLNFQIYAPISEHDENEVDNFSNPRKSKNKHLRMAL